MRNYFYKSVYIFIILSFLLDPVYAVQEFVIEDIRVEGLQRITPGTVFNYLPMKVGDTFDDTRSNEAVRALFKTGFFDDVRLDIRHVDVRMFLGRRQPGVDFLLNLAQRVESRKVDKRLRLDAVAVRLNHQCFR